MNIQKEMKINFEKCFSVLALMIIASMVFLPIGNSIVLADSLSAAPTAVAGPIINYDEELAGFDVSVNLAGLGDGIVAGDELELLQNGSSFNPSLAVVLSDNDEGVYSFTIDHGQLSEGQNSISYTIYHEGDPLVVSADLELTVDTVSPILSISAPWSGDYINGDELVDFESDAIVNECSFNNLDWSVCLAMTTTMSEIAGFDSVSDGLVTLYMRGRDEGGNVSVDQHDDIIKDVTGPTGTVVILNDHYLSDSIPSIDLQVNYSEVMDAGVKPVISFGTTTGLISPKDDGEWSEGENPDHSRYGIWTQSFTITDANELTEHVPVTSSGARDQLSNVEGLAVPGFVSINTKNPKGVVSISNNLIYKDNLVQTVTIHYDREMNRSSKPNILFNKGGNMYNISWGWETNTKYVIVVEHDGTREELDDVYAAVDESFLGGEDIYGNTEVASLLSSLFKIDTIHPNGYNIHIDQAVIDSGNKHQLSFTYSGAELGATYYYSIDDLTDKTVAITGSGTILTATGQVGNINVSKLKNETLTLTYYLVNEYGDRGVDVYATVVKDMGGSSSSYTPPKNPTEIIGGNSQEPVIPVVNENSKNQKVLGVKIYNTNPFRRNLNKERIAIGKFGKIYGRLPSTSSDWDKVWAIAYAGLNYKK